MKGYILLHRQMLDNPIVTKDTEHLAVWVYLLLNATHAEMDAMFSGERIKVKRGQLITGRKSIAEKLNINESKVQRILKLFENEQQIEQQMSNKNRLVTVINYHEYQKNEQQNKQQLNNNRTPTEQQLNTNKECISNATNDNNGNKEDTPSEKSDPIPYKEIVGYLNEQADRNFKHTTKKTQSLIKARWNEGNRLEDFKYAIDRKVEEWKDTDMDQYLRPDTLFGTKFEGYLNQKPANKHKTDKEKNNEKTYTDEELGIIEV